jgi:hypothetical protein
MEAVNPNWLRISMNPARGDGGTCYGDSGGPNFLGAGSGETDIVAATTVTGDFMCRRWTTWKMPGPNLWAGRRLRQDRPTTA